MFSRFGTVPVCDGRTDGRTHDCKYRASIKRRAGKNNCPSTVVMLATPGEWRDRSRMTNERPIELSSEKEKRYGGFI